MDGIFGFFTSQGTPSISELETETEKKAERLDTF